MAKYISESSKSDDLNQFKKNQRSKYDKSEKNIYINNQPSKKSNFKPINLSKKNEPLTIKNLIYVFLFFLWLAFSFSEIGIILNLLIVCLCIYFAPSIIGFKRKKLNSNSIFVINFFFGWSIFGWVLALIWAISNSNI